MRKPGVGKLRLWKLGMGKLWIGKLRPRKLERKTEAVETVDGQGN